MFISDPLTPGLLSPTTTCGKLQIQQSQQSAPRQVKLPLSGCIFYNKFQVYCKTGHLDGNFAGKTKNMMETERIKLPDGVRNLMAELWANHVKGGKANSCRVFMIDLPEPTEEEKRIMAANRANRKPFVLDNETLKESLDKAVGELGGW